MGKFMKKLVIINLGSTSTKVAYYEDRNCVYNENIKHSAADLSPFPDIMDQYEYRYEEVIKFLERKKIDPKTIDAFVSRCGNMAPAEGGVYEITSPMVEQIKTCRYGKHASNLGVQIAQKFCETYGAMPLTVDPPTTDEFEALARYSGHAAISRKSSFQALNQRAVGKKYAADVNKKYEDLNLIIVHLGGGISIVAHKQGRMVDGNNALDGDGPFSTNRTGDLPVGSLIDMCFSGKYTYAEMKKQVNGVGGLVSYVGENDVLLIEQRAANDPVCAEVLEAMCYQVAKSIGAAATVLKGKVDAILLTGGMANSKLLVGYIKERTDFIAPITAYPGEFEMETLALNGYEVLMGNIVPKKVK